MRNLFTLFLVLIACLNSFSQYIDSVSTNRNFIVKTTPSHIFDFDNTFTLGVERFYENNKSFQTEFGYGNSNQNLLLGIDDGNFNENSKYRNFNNYRLKFENKRYFTNVKTNKLTGNYLAFEVFSKLVTKNAETPIGRNLINNLPEYYEKIPVKYTRFVIGSHVKFGHQFKIFEDNPKKKSRYLIDVYVGLGFRSIRNNVNYKSKKENDTDIYAITSIGQVFSGNEKIIIPSATLGFKMGYIISGRKK